MKVKIDLEEFIDTDHLKRICEDVNGITIMYYAPDSERYFTVVEAGYKSEFVEVEEITEVNYVRKFVINNNDDAEVINNLIKKFNLGPELTEVI